MKRQLSKKEKIVKTVLQHVFGTIIIIGFLMMVGAVGNLECADEVNDQIINSDIHHNLIIIIAGAVTSFSGLMLGKLTGVFGE